MPGASGEGNGSLKYVDLRDFGDSYLNAIVSALHFQHKLFLREMDGALLPPAIPLDNVYMVMDFICGSGAWCIDFSKNYPDKQIYGLDHNHKTIALAQANIGHANAGRLEFQSIERTLPLPFADHTFDLIHIQSGTGLFIQSEWPAIIAEMYRLLRPGGWLNLVDFEIGPTSQPALDRVLVLLGRILSKLARSTAPIESLPLTGCVLGPQRMATHAFTEIGYRLYPVNLGGWQNSIGRAYLNSIVVRPEMILRLAIEARLATEEELRPLLREMQRELRQLSFCAVGMLLSSFGRKPLTDLRPEEEAEQV
jgi:ubiquinone/menaquinone biosynthesis C-methylase UbiE